MRLIDEITRLLEEENEESMLIVCSPKLENKIRNKIANMSANSACGVFKHNIDSPVTSVFNRGVTLHFTSDIDRLIEHSIEHDKNNS